MSRNSSTSDRAAQRPCRPRLDLSLTTSIEHAALASSQAVTGASCGSSTTREPGRAAAADPQGLRLADPAGEGC